MKATTQHTPERMRNCGGKRAAFTRVEMVAAVTALALLGTLALPLLATSRHEADRAACLNNLRLVGRAAMMWAGANGDQFSWHFVLAPDGGVRPPRFNNAWFEYAYLSNELATPRILACPADDGVRSAATFSEYVSVNYRAQATSYLINVHAMANAPRALLFSDRHARISSTFSQCPFVGTSADLISVSDTNIGWTNAVHGLQGNHVAVDGSLATTTPQQVRDVLRRSDVNGTIHTFRAR